MSRGLARVIGTAVGLGLLSLWWANHGEEVHALVTLSRTPQRYPCYPARVG